MIENKVKLKLDLDLLIIKLIKRIYKDKIIKVNYKLNKHKHNK
jgi:hypothetical protein